MTEPEDIAAMEMPCQCNCGEFFNLNDGNPCGSPGCGAIMCHECIPEPWADCPACTAAE